MKLLQVYYASNLKIDKIQPSIISYINALQPIRNLTEQETYQIDLTLTEEELFKNINKSNRSQIKIAATKPFTHIVDTNPSYHDLVEFQQFYNTFAKKKQTHLCNSFHLKTLKLLCEQHALVLTKILGVQKEILYYRIYLTDHIHALTLYSASQFRLNELPETKRLYSIASRYLLWKNILWFKESGHKVYDLGSLTTDKNIRQFKLGFGGEIVLVYSGYLSTNLKGRFILWVRKMKMISRWKYQ